MITIKRKRPFGERVTIGQIGCGLVAAGCAGSIGLFAIVVWIIAGALHWAMH